MQILLIPGAPHGPEHASVPGQGIRDPDQRSRSCSDLSPHTRRHLCLCKAPEPALQTLDPQQEVSYWSRS